MVQAVGRLRLLVRFSISFANAVFLVYLSEPSPAALALSILNRMGSSRQLLKAAKRVLVNIVKPVSYSVAISVQSWRF